MSEQPETLLGAYRALDLTDDRGYFCGRILGDLGADVIKIERPGGDPGRKIGPFYHDTPDPEKSLYWFAYNSNKRGISEPRTPLAPQTEAESTGLYLYLFISG